MELIVIGLDVVKSSEVSAPLRAANSGVANSPCHFHLPLPLNRHHILFSPHEFTILKSLTFVLYPQGRESLWQLIDLHTQMISTSVTLHSREKTRSFPSSSK